MLIELEPNSLNDFLNTGKTYYDVICICYIIKMYYWRHLILCKNFEIKNIIMLAVLVCLKLIRVQQEKIIPKLFNIECKSNYFLRKICQVFSMTCTLTPDSNEFHYHKISVFYSIHGNTIWRTRLAWKKQNYSLTSKSKFPTKLTVGICFSIVTSFTDVS